MFGLKERHWRSFFTASLSRSSTLGRPKIKKRRCSCNGVEYVVEVRRVSPYALLRIRLARSAAASLTLFGLKERHWRSFFTASLSRSSTLGRPKIKKRRCSCNGVEYVVEVRRVELLSTTANREVSSGLVGSLGGMR